MASVKIQGYGRPRVVGTGLIPAANGMALWRKTVTVTGSEAAMDEPVPVDVVMLRLHVKGGPVLMEIDQAITADSEEYPATADTPWVEYRGVVPGQTLRFKDA